MESKTNVLSALFILLVFMIISFISDNPIILISLFLFILTVFLSNKAIGKFKRGLTYLVPFAILTIIINMLFVNDGNIILFEFLGKKFTLEAFLYALIICFKLLIVIYIFFTLELLIDTDDAVSFFSSIVPKSTFSFLIASKLFPNLKIRVATLMEIYSFRGLDFSEKSKKKAIKNFVPIFSIILEDSLEGSFQIGEAAYVRGFLSTKRTVYERKKLKFKDYILIGLSLLLFILFLYLNSKGYFNFDIYGYAQLGNIINYYVAIVFSIVLVITYILTI
ncbi:MAG: energy-coupling factor transporter transmembrane component T [Clostridiaceae bacterium]